MGGGSSMAGSRGWENLSGPVRAYTNATTAELCRGALLLPPPASAGSRQEQHGGRNSRGAGSSRARLPTSLKVIHFFTPASLSAANMTSA